MAAMYSACVANHVSDEVVLICFTIGVAENSWDNNTCNSSNHCGVFQLDSTWQAQHDYHDTYYWTGYALHNGFFGYGGILSIVANHGAWTIGQKVEACQGAGPDFQSAADYYDGRVPEASVLAGYFKGHGISAGGAGTPTTVGTEGAQPSPAVGGVFDLFSGLNWAGDFENLWVYVQGGSDEAAAMADSFETSRINNVTTIGWE